jgi:hypothetical protein
MIEGKIRRGRDAILTTLDSWRSRQTRFRVCDSYRGYRSTNQANVKSFSTGNAQVFYRFEWT